MSVLLDELVPSSERSARAVEALQELVGPAWSTQVERVLEARCRSVCVVFDGPGTLSNSWACLRTMDCFGVQCAEMIDQDGADPVRLDGMEAALCSQPWITVRRWPDAGACVSALRREGYRILAMDLDDGSIALDELLPQLACSSRGGDASAPPQVAVVIGNEINGISDEMRQLADWRGFLPMAGMSRSFNFSVACGVLLATLDLHGLLLPGGLDSTERARLRLHWLLAACSESADVESVLKSAAADERAGLSEACTAAF